jgi:hypothetical protein
MNISNQLNGETPERSDDSLVSGGGSVLLDPCRKSKISRGTGPEALERVITAQMRREAAQPATDERETADAQYETAMAAPTPEKVEP